MASLKNEAVASEATQTSRQSGTCVTETLPGLDLRQFKKYEERLDEYPNEYRLSSVEKRVNYYYLINFSTNKTHTLVHFDQSKLFNTIEMVDFLKACSSYDYKTELVYL